MFILGGKQAASRRSSRSQQIQNEMATAVREACDAATADVAREKWLELEVERQRQVADASVEQLSCVERDKKELVKRVKQLEGALAQHETYAKLEAQGAQQVELEMRRLRLQVKEKSLEVQALKQKLEGAKQQLKADAKAGAVLGAATNAAWEDHRQLLRKLFALVVRGSAAVQALNAAMQQPMRAAAYPAGMSQCVEVLESLIALRQTCAHLLSAGGMSSSTLPGSNQGSFNGAAAPGPAFPAAESVPPPWRGAYSNGGAAPEVPSSKTAAYQPQSIPAGPASYSHDATTAAGAVRCDSLQQGRGYSSYGMQSSSAAQRLPPTAEGYSCCFDHQVMHTDNGTYSTGDPGAQGMPLSHRPTDGFRSNTHNGVYGGSSASTPAVNFNTAAVEFQPRASSGTAIQRLRRLQGARVASGQLHCSATSAQNGIPAGSYCTEGADGSGHGYGSQMHKGSQSPYGMRSSRCSEYHTPHSEATGSEWWQMQ